MRENLLEGPLHMADPVRCAGEIGVAGDRHDLRSLRRFGLEDGLPGSVVRSVVEDRAGALWFGTNGGVARWDGRAFRSFRAGDDVSEDAVNALYVDDAGRLWAGTAAGLSNSNPVAAFT